MKPGESIPVSKLETCIPGFDLITEGGLPAGRSTLVSGTAGTGQTLMATHFFSSVRTAATWGMDLRALQDNGQLEVISVHPEDAGIEDHLIAMRAAVERHQPDRVVVDSLSALERIGSEKSFRELVITLRYVELQGEMRRCLAIIEMRGSSHDHAIHELTIDEKGLHIGPRLHNVSGILNGNPAFITWPAKPLGGRESGEGDHIP